MFACPEYSDAHQALEFWKIFAFSKIREKQSDPTRLAYHVSFETLF